MGKASPTRTRPGGWRRRCSTLHGYTQELVDTYGSYYRLARRFVRLIGQPGLVEKLVAMGMRSKSVMSFAFTMLGNLDDHSAGGVQQRGFKLLKRLAEIKP